MLLSEFKAVTCMLNKHFVGHHIMKYHLRNVAAAKILQYLEMPTDTPIPKERDKYNHTKYVFGVPLGQIHEHLTDMSQYIELNDEDKALVQEINKLDAEVVLLSPPSSNETEI
jgi:hypothetical protein